MGFRFTAWRLIALVVALISTFGAFGLHSATGAAVAAAEVPSVWSRPVPGRVVHPFVAPKSRYGSGHRGVDFAASIGTPVQAARAGVVTFAGMVGGTLHVVIDHGGGIRTSMSFLATVNVRSGQHVARGEAVGTTGGAGPDHGVGVLHFGVRIGEDYVDPMALFAAVDLTAAIHLAPVHHEPSQTGLVSRPNESRSLADSLHLPRAIPGLTPEQLPNLWEQLVSGTEAGLEGTFDGAEWGVGVLVKVGYGASLSLWHLVRDRTPVGALAGDLHSMASRFMAYQDAQDNCTANGSAPSSPLANLGSGHRLMAVGGINSSTNAKTGATFGLDTKALGYLKGEVNWFSYAPDGGGYQPNDTYGDVLGKAVLLRDQLRAMQREQPGVEVDLIAHSQGGVVVDAFMQLVYDPTDRSLPPLGTAATLSSPHQGAPLAQAGLEIRESFLGRKLLDGVEWAAGGAIPPSNGVSTRQLAPSSHLMKRLWAKPLPVGFDFTSFGASDDPIVPAPQTVAPGARSVMVNPDGLGDHSAIVSDPSVMRDVRLALELRSPQCVGLFEGIRGAVEPVLIRRAEVYAGTAAGDALKSPIDAVVP